MHHRINTSETVAAKLTGTTGAYNSDLNAFIFTTEQTGATATIGYATAGSGGTDLSTLLGLTQAAGAVLPQAEIAGVAALVGHVHVEVFLVFVGDGRHVIVFFHG